MYSLNKGRVLVRHSQVCAKQTVLKQIWQASAAQAVQYDVERYRAGRSSCRSKHVRLDVRALAQLSLQAIHTLAFHAGSHVITFTHSHTPACLHSCVYFRIAQLSRLGMILILFWSR
jgi:hypothetical protein